MAISAAQVKELRKKTGLGVMDCKQALQDTDGDIEKAIEILRKRGLADAAKRASRTTADGRIGSYIHPPGRVGVLVELNCETDFVAKSADFQDLLRDLCMQVAASRPTVVSRDQLCEEALERERDIYRAQAQDKPEHIQEKIVESKLDAFCKETVLLEQPFVKEPKKTIEQIIKATIAKVGENITVRRFARFALGEED